MSIPLDRLYHYIDNVAQDIRQDDVLIYHYYPHGSKKLSDLHPLNDYTQRDWFTLMTTVSMICHDQEPLDYHLYSDEEFWNEYTQRSKHKLLTKEHIPQLPKTIADMHVRSKLLLPFNCYDKVLLCHSEKNSQNLNLYESSGFIGVYWWSHAIIARDWFRYASHDSKLAINFKNINKDFLIYNRAWSGTREYRLLFAELIADNNLIESCNIKFSPLDSGFHYSDHQFKNKNLSIKRTDLQDIYPLNTFDPCSSADYDSTDYATSGIEIVLETLFDDQRNHLTEKSLRPIACGRPFMLVSTPGSLKYLQEYGFETFHSIIDESYDQIIDPVQRLNAVIQEMYKIKNLNQTQKLELWEELYKISKRNQQRFFSSQWTDSIISEYSTNLKSALTEIETHATGKYWHLIRELGQNSAEFVKACDTDTPFRTVQQKEKVLEWLAKRNQ